MRGDKRVCVDVGGTFTDCLVLDESGALQQFKAPTWTSEERPLAVSP